MSRVGPGKKKGSGTICRNGPKGAAHKWFPTPFSILKWAFSEAAVLMIRESDQAKCFVQRLEAKHPGAPGHALAVLRAHIGRAVYYMLKRKEPFDLGRFFSGVRSRSDAASSQDITGSSSLCSGDATAGDASGR